MIPLNTAVGVDSHRSGRNPFVGWVSKSSWVRTVGVVASYSVTVVNDATGQRRTRIDGHPPGWTSSVTVRCTMGPQSRSRRRDTAAIFCARGRSYRVSVSLIPTARRPSRRVSTLRVSGDCGWTGRTSNDPDSTSAAVPVPVQV